MTNQAHTDRQPTPRPDVSPVTVGWREEVALPDLGVAALRAKVDTGARTSALHCRDWTTIEVGGQDWLSFEVHVDGDRWLRTRAPLVARRRVRSSSGVAQRRPVIATTLWMAGLHFDVQVTLSHRPNLRFRMLVGRRALSGRFLVDSSASWLGGSPPDLAHLAGTPPEPDTLDTPTLDTPTLHTPTPDTSTPDTQAPDTDEDDRP